MQPTRRLAAILFTDIVGSTSMMQKDEQHAVSINRRYVAVLKECVLPKGGEILNDFGDGSLCCFHSATEALRCAIEMQHKFQIEPKVPLRIGLHVGEIFFEDGKVLGDGVNVASRVQSLGIANSILFSSEICSKIRNQSEFTSVSIGRFHFKNVDEPMEVFALTNNGLVVPKKEELAGKLKEEKKKSTIKKWIATAIIIALLGVSFFLYKFYHNTGFTGDKAIAVLPFETIGTDKSEEYVSDGITQDIINNLSKVASIQKVIAWFSVRGFRNSQRSLKEIADQLGVAAILTGTIERQPNNIHIVAELVDVSNNKRLWGEDYNYNSKDLLSIQSDLAAHIVNALSASITPREKQDLTKHSTENIDAYKFYRKGRFFWDQRNKAAYDSAEVYYKKAIDLDPDYALAYSGLADCYTFNQKGLSQLEAIPIAKDYAQKALSLDSTLTEAWTTIGFIQSHFEYNWKDAKILLEKIIKDNPKYPIAHLYYGNVLLAFGKTDEALVETKRALALDPLSAVINYVLGREYFHTRKYDSAIIQLRKNINLNPKFINSYVPLGEAYTQKKLYADAINAFSKLPGITFDLGSNGFLLQSYVYNLSGDSTNAKLLFDKVSKQDLLQAPYLLACIYISRGNFNEALTQLEYAYQVHAIQMAFITVDPMLDPLRKEPRFEAIIKKMNLE